MRYHNRHPSLHPFQAAHVRQLYSVQTIDHRVEFGHALTDHKANQLTALSDQLNWVLICLPDAVCLFENGRTPV